MQTTCSVEEAFKLKYPEPVVLVTTRRPDGAPNVMAVAWVMIVSSEPWMFGLGIDEQAYTYELISQTREFVVAFPHEGMARETLYVGEHHGRDRDKVKECGLALQDASVVHAPLVRDAIANFECELTAIHRPGDCPLILGRVVAAHRNEAEGLHRLYLVGPGYQLGGVRPA